MRDQPRPQGRPQVITTERIIAAGRAITLEKLTMRGLAEHLGVSEMSIYRHVGNLENAKTIVAEGILAAEDINTPQHDDPENALLQLACNLREFVLNNPGIGVFLSQLHPTHTRALEIIEKSQASYAKHFGWEAAKASIAVSIVAEHAIALAHLNPRNHHMSYDQKLDPALNTISAGAAAITNLSPHEMFIWSMRATTCGVLDLLELMPKAN